MMRYSLPHLASRCNPKFRCLLIYNYNVAPFCGKYSRKNRRAKLTFTPPDDIISRVPAYPYADNRSFRETDCIAGGHSFSRGKSSRNVFIARILRHCADLSRFSRQSFSVFLLDERARIVYNHTYGVHNTANKDRPSLRKERLSGGKPRYILWVTIAFTTFPPVRPCCPSRCLKKQPLRCSIMKVPVCPLWR